LQALDEECDKAGFEVKGAGFILLLARSVQMSHDAPHVIAPFIGTVVCSLVTFIRSQVQKISPPIYVYPFDDH
jgi:hypothetical protein